MKPTKSDISMTKTHLIMVRISVILTILFYLCIAVAIGIYSSRVDAGDYLKETFSHAWSIAFILMFHDLTGSTGPEMMWWTMASTLGTIGVGMNIGVLTTSILGLRVRKIDGISWVGFLLGIIGAGVSLSVIFNVMLWWLPGFVLTVMSWVYTKQTLNELNEWQPAMTVEEKPASDGSSQA